MTRLDRRLSWRTPGLWITAFAVVLALALATVATVLVIRQQADAQRGSGAGADATVRLTAADFAADNARTAAFVAEPSADGTYLQAARELAAFSGVTLDEDYSGLFVACPDRERNDAAIASVCPLDLSRIFVNTEHTVYDSFIRRIQFIDTIRHELAHIQIGRICGEVAPPVAGDRYEAVTSSYADAHLGLDADRWNADAMAGYGTDAESDRIAADIAAGECG